MEKKQSEFIISRTMYCPSCFARRKPTRGDLFVVYKHDHDCLVIKTNHVFVNPGYSPHLVSWNDSSPIKDGKIQLLKCCSVNFCGIYIDPKEYKDAGQDVVVNIQFVNTEYFWLPLNEFEALKEKWRGNTGYNLH